MSIIGETMTVWGQGIYEKSLYLPLNFVVNLKTALKNKVFKKNTKDIENK